MLYQIDNWLLGNLEKFSHYWQKLIGKNCFFFARIAALFAGVFMFFSFFLVTSYGQATLEEGNSFILFFWFLVPMPFVLTLFSFKIIKNIEIIVLDKNSKGLSNPLKIFAMSRLRGFSVLLIALSSMYFFIVLDDIFMQVFIYFFIALVFYIISDYFLACDTLPPKKSKLKNWLEKSKNYIKLKLA